MKKNDKKPDKELLHMGFNKNSKHLDELKPELEKNRQLQQAVAFWGLQEPSGQYFRCHEDGKIVVKEVTDEKWRTWHENIAERMIDLEN